MTLELYDYFINNGMYRSFKAFGIRWSETPLYRDSKCMVGKVIMFQTRSAIVSIGIIGLMLLSSWPTMGLMDPDDDHWDDQWDLQLIEADDAWELDNVIEVGETQRFTNTGSQSIIVAVCDSGLNWHPTDANKRHPDFNINSVWKNPSEEAGDANTDGRPGIAGVDDDGDGLIDEDVTGLEWGSEDEPAEGYDTNYVDDDDENGYIDDIYGFNFFNKRGDADDLGDDGWYYDHDVEYDPELEELVYTPILWDNHGTRVTGLISAVINNDEGVCGVAPNVRIMILKIADNVHQSIDDDEPNYYTPYEKMDAAIQFAIDNGADIIVTTEDYTPNIDESVDITEPIYEEAYNKGIVIFAAGGNDGAYPWPDLKVPAKYESVIAVGALDSDNNRASYSSYRTGGDIESYFYRNPEVTVPSGDHYQCEEQVVLVNEEGCSNNYYYWPQAGDDLIGTHYAVAPAAATAAMILSYRPTMSPGEVRSILHLSSKDVTYPQVGDSNEYVGWDHFTGYGRLNVKSALETTLRMKPDFTPGFEDGEASAPRRLHPRRRMAERKQGRRPATASAVHRGRKVCGRFHQLSPQRRGSVAGANS